MGVGYTHTFGMRPRDVLAKNLKALMASTPSLATFKQIVDAGGPSNGTLDRIRRKTHATSVDTLEQIADVFGVEPWQLLRPSIEPSASPKYAAARKALAKLNEIELTSLFAAVQQPGLDDHNVEERIPITRKRTATKAPDK